MSSYQNFEQQVAASTYPLVAGRVKKGAFYLLKDQPCKVTQFSTSKSGKHGHSKASIVGTNIFTGKRVEDSCPTSHNIQVPVVNKIELSLIDITEENYLSLLSDSYEVKEDIKLPEIQPELAQDIKQQFEKAGDESQVYVTILQAMGQEKVISVRSK